MSEQFHIPLPGGGSVAYTPETDPDPGPGPDLPAGGKAWYRSRTIIGAVIALASSAAGLVGWGLEPADQAVLADAVIAITGAAGGLLAIWGRLRATHEIAPLRPRPRG